MNQLKKSIINHCRLQRVVESHWEGEEELANGTRNTRLSEVQFQVLPQLPILLAMKSPHESLLPLFSQLKFANRQMFSSILIQLNSRK